MGLMMLSTIIILKGEKMSKLEFGKYTEVTKRAKEFNKEFFNENERVFICPDVHNFWIAKILVGINEDYEEQEDCVLIERNNIDEVNVKYLKMPHRLSDDELIDLILNIDSEDGSNWDVLECDSIEDAIEQLSDGFGIILEEEAS